MIAAGNILRHELMGLPVEVVRSANPAQEGIAGRVVDETRNMLVIGTPRGEKRIEKAHATFRLTLPDGTVADVSGIALVGQPEKRITQKKRF
ncbi:MAG TPA: ribonuclease P protein component 1 [Methanomicrobiales archaeon]|nr:ribonuclease P protein component 1 [Methanomicrobiales archaeon]